MTIPALIPAPQHLEPMPGAFRIDGRTGFELAPEARIVAEAAEELAGKVRAASGFPFPLVASPSREARGGPGGRTPGRSGSDGRGIVRVTIDSGPASPGPEGYRLRAEEHGLEIIGGDAAGAFYGLQTLRQLLPPEIEGGNAVSAATSWVVPGLRIEDRPRFPWRGLLLDCARHFMAPLFVEGLLDLLALYKMNRFHWHLTEDQGWRLPVPGFPRLVEIGAWRRQADGSLHGGFYSQGEIRSIVDRASSLQITIVPEIEMPGHAVAALASYPELSCSGGPFTVEHRWGIFEDVFCAGNEAVFGFLEAVLTEVALLFPGSFVHLGGDEVPKTRWRDCPRCQATIHREGLGGEEELQGYFLHRVTQMLASHRRRAIGWDEVLDGGLPPQVIVQSWRGFEGAATAARMGHETIVSPTSHAYFDYSLDTLDLRRVYSFDPLPPGLGPRDAGRVLGGECNLWTERIPQDRVHRMLFPRLLAMAERLWSGPGGGGFSEFQRRVDRHGARLRRLGVALEGG